jgi:hypothetical protein
LNKAITDARQRKDSVVSILIKDFKIPKKDIGKSLSNYYKVQFIEFNSTFPIPGELLTGLKVPFMRNNVWVPIRLEEGKVAIAVDNPHDLQKIDEIKALFPGKQLKYYVALKKTFWSSSNFLPMMKKSC